MRSAAAAAASHTAEPGNIYQFGSAMCVAQIAEIPDLQMTQVMVESTPVPGSDVSIRSNSSTTEQSIDSRMTGHISDGSLTPKLPPSPQNSEKAEDDEEVADVDFQDETPNPTAPNPIAPGASLSSISPGVSPPPPPPQPVLQSAFPPPPPSASLQGFPLPPPTIPVPDASDSLISNDSNTPPPWFQQFMLLQKQDSVRSQIAAAHARDEDRKHLNDVLNNLNTQTNDRISGITGRMDKLTISCNQSTELLNAKFDQLSSRIDVLEKDKTRSAEPPHNMFDDEGSAPRKVGRFVKPSNISQAQSPAPPDPHVSKSGLLSNTPTPTQVKAMKPTCLRLRGFQCQLPKKDMIDLASQLCVHAGIAHDSIVDIHSSNIAASCVVEFISESHTRKALQLSKAAKWTWKDPITEIIHNLFFSYDESQESRNVGQALHVLWDSAAKHILPNCPTGTLLSIQKAKGELIINIQGRGYTLVTIAFADNESSFKLVQKKGRWANSLPHAHVTQPMIQAVIAECFVDGILTI